MAVFPKVKQVSFPDLLVAWFTLVNARGWFLSYKCFESQPPVSNKSYISEMDHFSHCTLQM